MHLHYYELNRGLAAVNVSYVNRITYDGEEVPTIRTERPPLAQVGGTTRLLWAPKSSAGPPRMAWGRALGLGRSQKHFVARSIVKVPLDPSIRSS